MTFLIGVIYPIPKPIPIIHPYPSKVTNIDPIVRPRPVTINPDMNIIVEDAADIVKFLSDNLPPKAAEIPRKNIAKLNAH